MSYSSRRLIARVKRSVVSMVIIGAMGFPLSPSQAEVSGDHARLLLESTLDLLRKPRTAVERTNLATRPKQIETTSQREDRVTNINLCPRQLLMYVGEEYILSPLPLDSSRNPVHGVVFSWESNNPKIAEVASNGSLTANSRGECVVTAMVGRTRAKVRVEVRDGSKPQLTTAEWDVEHANDCTDPEKDPPGVTKDQADSIGAQSTKVTPQLLVPDPDEPPDIPEAGSRPNAIGHPRFSPNAKLQASPAGTDNQLGSSSFNLTIPIFGAGGRGVGVDATLVYNSRVWTKNDDQIIFDYDGGWPAPGFRLNYGRIIPNYDVPIGSSGNYLLVEADGTRTPLLSQGGGLYRSEDGRYIEFLSSSNKLFLPDGTTVSYNNPYNNKLLPVLIKDINGNSISISYFSSCSDAQGQRVEACTCGSGCSRPARQGIKQISDTLGRFVTYYYYANGELAEIRGPAYNGAPDRIIAKFYYQTITLSYNFGSLTVTGAPSGGQVDVLRRVYFPDTGRGYVFDGYQQGSSPVYGMFTHASMRLGMTDTFDGTEIGYTEYTFQTSGALLDSPEIIERREWWQGKTDDSGNQVTTPALYTYSRASGSSTMTDTVSGPSGPNSTTTVMVTNNDEFSPQFGLLIEQRIESGSAVKLKQEFFYDNPSPTGGGLQRNRVITTDDGSPAKQTQTDFSYADFGRLTRVVEFGYPDSGTFKKRRRTDYDYAGDALNPNDPYIQKALYHLVKDVTVFDAKLLQNNSLHVKIARSGFIYDTADVGWELQKYDLTYNCSPPTCTPPPGYDTKFVDNPNNNVRGVPTKTLLWSDATSTNADISFRHQFDVFGNELKGEVSCCSLKRFTFSPNASGMFYSVPLSDIDGPTSGPNLANAYAYDFNTSFLNSQTDPNGLVTSYTADAALRLRIVTYPKLANDTNANPTLETFYADAQNNPSTTDTLVYQSRFTYFDGTTQKVNVSNQWLDGGGQTLRDGSASGPTIASFDVEKKIYDELGRLRKSTNPYNTTNSDGDTTGLPNATVYDYDALDRVVTVTLPDGSGTGTVTTNYNGSLTTVTDQAGRQKRSETDGLGRTIKVTEMDNSQVLAWDTTYGYDMNGNLTNVNQGGQIRAFKYDSLSRMTFESSPEQNATISDGTSTWSAKYTYTSFNSLQTREDARHAVSTYSYDGLNRLFQVGYTLPNPNPDNVQPTPTVNITYGSAAPKNGQIEELKQSYSPSDVPWKENYAYDGLSRPLNKTVTFDNQAQSYTTGYAYNQWSQLIQITYPSQRVVKYGFDQRGRLQTLGDGSLSTRYISSVGYQPSDQIGNINLGNGVNETYGFSADRLQLTSQTATKSGNTLMNLAYNYVASKTRAGGSGSAQANTGQLMDITATIKDPNNNSLQRNESYNYDQAARLAQGSGFYAQRNYTYDRWGNRTAVSGGSSQTVTLQQPGGVTNNRIATVNGVSYSYDAAGDLTSDGVHSYSYDAEGRAVKVDSGSTATYSYDSASRRVKKLQGAFTTYYIWEGNQVVAEYSNAPGGPGGTRFYHPDRLSNRTITDSAGVVKGTMDHLPFGEDGGVVGENEKHRFTSYERDSETGSDYAVNRQHSFTTGRFMRADPVPGNATNPQSLNRYAYVQNDPVNSVDPLGLLTICFWSVVTVKVGWADDPDEVERLVLDECFDLGSSFGFIGGGRGGGGGEKKRQSRKNPKLTNKKCKEVLQEIKKLMDDVQDRFNDLEEDVDFLSISGNKDEDWHRRRKEQNPGGGKRDTHESQYNDKRKALDRKLLEYDRGQCNGRGGPGEGPVLKTARQMHFWKVPDAKHGLTHPSVSLGQQLWDNVPIMPVNPYVPAFRFRIRIPLRIPVFP